MYRARIKTKYNEFYLEEENIKDLLEIFDQPYIESIYLEQIKEKSKENPKTKIKNES